MVSFLVPHFTPINLIMSSIRPTIVFSLTFSFCLLIIHVTSSIPIQYQQHQHKRNSAGEIVGGESIIRVRRNVYSGDHIRHTHSHSHTQNSIPINIREKNENSAYKSFEMRDVNKNQQQQPRSENTGERSRRQMPSRNDAEYRYNRDATTPRDRNRRASEMNNNIVKQSAEIRTQNQNRDSNTRTTMNSNTNPSPSQSPLNYLNSKPTVGTQIPAPPMTTTIPISASRNQYQNQNAVFNSTSATATSSPSTSVVVVSGLSKYSVLHLVPPTGTQIHEIQNTLDDPQQRYALNNYKNKNSDSVSEKTGLAIVLIEFDVLDDEDDTYETIVETVDFDYELIN